MNQFLTKRVAKFTYDVAVHGGVKNTSIVIGKLPKNAYVTDGWAYIATTPVGATTTLALGITGATGAFYAATTATTLADTVGMLKLLPGVLNIGDSQPITTVDTPAEIVAIGRVSGATYNTVKTTANVDVLVTLSNDNNLTAGKIHVYLEYFIVG